MNLLYRSSQLLGLNVSIVYDALPQSVLRLHNQRFSFVKVRLSDFDAHLGVNDVRYFFFRRLIMANTHWTTVFTVDLFDVKIGMNPCRGVKGDHLYAGKEITKLATDPFIRRKFKMMGGKYLTWFDNVDKSLYIVNAGVLGGRRQVFLPFLDRVIEALTDPLLTARRSGAEVNVNMPAVNFVAYTQFRDKLVAGFPITSTFFKYEWDRTDVWFIHK